jgi:hypothetical protein
MGRLREFATKPRLAVASILLLVMVGAVAVRLYFNAFAEERLPLQSQGAASPGAMLPSGAATEKTGLLLNDARAFQGYTLLAPLAHPKTYLIDMEGRVVKTWETNCGPGLSAYLLEDGHLLRSGLLAEDALASTPGAGGRFQEFAWDGSLLWDFQWANSKQLPHHDFCRLPNGNLLAIVWEKKTAREAVAAGRKPETTGDPYLLPDCVMELKPVGKTAAEVVWQWHIWDHLIQDHNPARANYGDVAAHPELIDINYGEGVITSMASKDGKDGDALKKLRSLGYIGSPAPGKKLPKINPDWTHINSVAYNADLDQIMLSVYAFSEIWIIDHSTTAAQAAGHSGGRSGKGGDLLYRWGNPRAYRAGSIQDQRLANQHDAHWIPPGLPGVGHVLVFNNGTRRPPPEGSYSSVDEIVIPVNSNGQYMFKSRTASAPDQPAWTYSAPNKSEFFAQLMSGAQRLPNGNTLICSSLDGLIFEVTEDKRVVWKYRYAVGGSPVAAVASRTACPNATFWAVGDGFLPEHGEVLCSFLEEPDVAPAAAKGAVSGVGGQAPASLFRAYRYAPGYAGLAGKVLKPGKTLEELQRQDSGKKSSH